MHEITWPEKFLPGTTDNFVSNEVIVSGVSFQSVADNLLDAARWPTYYDNSSDLHVHSQDDTVLRDHTRFRFRTFGFDVESEVEECSVSDDLIRLSWHGWNEAAGDPHIDIYHGWIVEKLSDGRIRILTQESQIGEPSRKMAGQKPNVMLNGHQDWLDGLVAAARAA
ncbi:MAG: SRPBCC domain-containing protein [Clostridia bacterium]|nr:SRPBCC domain-containing protein [Clostridia bacterium]